MSDVVLTVVGASHPSCPDISGIKVGASLLALSREELKDLLREKGIRWRGPIEFMSRRVGERQGFKGGTERAFFRFPQMDKDPTAYWLVACQPADSARLMLRVHLGAPVPEFN